MASRLVAIATGILLSATSLATAAQTTVNLWLTGPGYDKFLEKVLPEFEKQNPDIKVEWLNLGWDNYQQKILTGFAGGAAPDVFSFYSVDVSAWASRNMFQSLDAIVERDKFIESALASGEYNGQIYAVPLGMRMRPLFYRKDILAEAGFNEPPATWEQLEAYAKATVKRDGAGNLERAGFWVPTGHPYKTPQHWLAFLWNAGGEVFSADGKTAAFNGPEGVVATEFLARLLREDRVDEAGSIKADNVDFAQGKAAMMVSNIAARGVTQNTPDLVPQIGIALPPGKARQQVELAGEMLGIANTSGNPVAAEKLLRFLALNPETATEYALWDSTMPALKEVANSARIESNPWLPTYVKLSTNARPLPAHPRWNEISTIITQALDEVYLKGRPVKESLDAAADKVDRILAR